jgi:hypothetical protein
MKKIIISSIVAFSLYSCSTTKPYSYLEGACENEIDLGHHFHFEKKDGKRIILKIDNKTECKMCKQSLK